ncbi:mitofilin family membrane protein [Thalassobaculum sp. OXR-137]|uniref:COG4223 family protein n=1 Tax=Thalassobaculum sp. OXR-137 TaxID=3100173 RepID=UPI002AC9F15B|nr:mitofilin family membrane protein [Thalassobaculum sp. OXR-137]WPZ35621.1 mitofilin family membrane protein [Thalassobaculum sp. OXR-137]
MAETPKAENETGATVTGGEGADTLSAPSSGLTAASAEDRAAGAGADTLAGGSAGGSAAGGSDSVSGAAASNVPDPGMGEDSLSDDDSRSEARSSASASAANLAGKPADRPWGASSETVSSSESRSSSDTAKAGSDTGSSTTATPRSSGSSGGAGRLVVFLILIVLVGGIGYATYPEWRDEAAPYAEMVGVTLPVVPAETDPDAPKDPAPAASSSTSDTAPAVSAPVSADASDATGPASQPGTDTGADTGAVTAAAFEALSERVSALESEIKRLADAPAADTSAGTNADTTAASDLAERIASLENRFTALADEMSIVRQGLGSAEDTDGVAAVTSNLSGRLSEMDARLSELETQDSAPPAVSPEDLAALRERVDGLQDTSEGGDADLVARLDSIAATQKDLADRLAQGRNRQEQAGAFLLATNLLAAASSDSGDFAAELDAVETAALDQPQVGEAVATLKSHAAGVPSEADLRARFPAVAASVIDASIVGADDGVVGTALTRIASLVTLRRTETEEGDDIDAIVNRAEAAANAGDLPGAVQALGALDGDPAKVAAPWIAEANARIAVDRAVRTLQSRALATLSGG